MMRVGPPAPARVRRSVEAATPPTDAGVHSSPELATSQGARPDKPLGTDSGLKRPPHPVAGRHPRAPFAKCDPPPREVHQLCRNLPTRSNEPRCLSSTGSRIIPNASIVAERDDNAKPTQELFCIRLTPGFRRGGASWHVPPSAANRVRRHAQSACYFASASLPAMVSSAFFEVVTTNLWNSNVLNISALSIWPAFH